ncbi:hypothetical protein QN277_023729 [Acacia crassicarpa]|uniref:Knottins-like domain-containing protein n=1 Tax=Acacia crassicarpa TaxID=499986 RepID=A0AAE1JF30_9FABA|nr:hypothetical protein QN277_023729 [Acacia crassicarpa]
MERKSLVFVCAILILLLAQEVVVKTEALCDRPSRFFQGRCVGPADNRRCDIVCRTRDRAIRGRCVRSRCICTFNTCPLPLSDDIDTYDDADIYDDADTYIYK